MENCPLIACQFLNHPDFNRLDDLVASSPAMPPEYANVQARISCHDCSQVTESPLHYVYHKCGGCGGYNTRVIQLKKT
jgi:zinc finger-like protein